MFCSAQDQVSGTTTTMVLKNLEPNTEYTVTVVPVYHEMEGKSQSKNGKTREFQRVRRLNKKLFHLCGLKSVCFLSTVLG